MFSYAAIRKSCRTKLIYNNQEPIGLHRSLCNAYDWKEPGTTSQTVLITQLVITHIIRLLLMQLTSNKQLRRPKYTSERKALVSMKETRFIGQH